MKQVILILFLSVILITLVSADSVGVPNSGFTEGRVVYTPPSAPINYSTIATVNSTDWWDDLDTPADIEYSLPGGYNI